MTTVVTRAGKGSSLSYAEMDANFTNLNNAKLETGHPATDVLNVPSGTIASTNVQAAINELDIEKAPKTSPIFNGTLIVQVGGIDAQRFGSDTSGQLAGFRNKLINGGFNTWQRGIVSVSGYTADRFFTDVSNATVYKSGTPSSPAGNFYSVATVGTGSGFANPRQAIERDTVYTLRGKTVTFSGFTECSAGFVGTLTVTAGYSNSTDTIAGVSTIVATKSITPITSKVPFSLTFNVPADAVGLTVGFNHTNAQSTGVQTAWGDFQLEEGSIATPFENRPIGLELALCQRYYEIGASSMESTLSLGGYRQMRVSYRVEKRIAVTPTITGSNFSPTVDSGSTSSFRVYNSTVNAFDLTWAAPAEL